MKLRLADTSDLRVIMLILSQARQAQRDAGFVQWEDGYPPADAVLSDISEGNGYILDDDGVTAGYIAIATSDPEYERHPELWDTDNSYTVFHRIALSDDYRGKGLSNILFDLAESLSRTKDAEYVRIDTGVENRPMQHILSKRNYRHLGECDFIWGKRLAYEKRLT